MTWYGEVASKVTAVSLDPYSSLMNHLPGAVFEDEHADGGPALTSIVTQKYGDKEPGKGFYTRPAVSAIASKSRTSSGPSKSKTYSSCMGSRVRRCRDVGASPLTIQCPD